MPIETPVLFLVFNRPSTTLQSFQELRKAKPKRLYVAADGPRSHIDGEAERCAEVRKIFDQIDWDCQLETRFLETNLGCGKGVSSAITWFFQNVEEGIILEDDCIPDPTFFAFCTDMLKRYRLDARVMIVTGNNFQDGHVRGDASYYFSKLTHIWGWATWKRVWDLYDYRMISYPDFKNSNGLTDFHESEMVQTYFMNIFDRMHSKPIDTWDYQLFYTVLKNQGLCITPNTNLVTNIGFGADATHTLDPSSKIANLAKHAIQQITHPTVISVNRQADDYALEHGPFGIPLSKQYIAEPSQKSVREPALKLSAQGTPPVVPPQVKLTISQRIIRNVKVWLRL